MIEVRLAKKDDMDDIIEVQIASFRAAFQSFLRDETLKLYTDYNFYKKIFGEIMSENLDNWYVGLLDDKICAQIYWCANDDGSSEIVALHSSPKSWGSGLGKALMDKVLDDISKSGCKKVFLWMFEKNFRAGRFYEKYGFSFSGKSRISDFDNEIECKYVFEI